MNNPPLSVSASVTSHGYLPQTPYPEYRCPRKNPLNCRVLRQLIEQPTDDEIAQICPNCSFPAMLAQGQVVSGRLGKYEIEQYWGKRNRGRLYRAIKFPGRQRVFLKEYLLPKLHFTPTEAQWRKETFLRCAGFTLADGRVNHFRLMQIIEVIADAESDRCYLISPDCHNFTTLGYLARLFTHQQVRHLLDQVLQSLKLLHTQKWRLPSGLVLTGLTHGNLTADSLLFVPHQSGFFIYLCDLGLWENLFNVFYTQANVLSPPSQLSQDEPHDFQAKVHQDLKDLGQVAQVLLGYHTDTGESQPREQLLARSTSSRPDLALIDYIDRLQQADFINADDARQALLALKPSPKTTTRQSLAVLEQHLSSPQKTTSRWLIVGMLGACGLLVLALLGAWLTLRHRQPMPQIKAASLCCLTAVTKVPIEPIRFAATDQGSWERAWMTSMGSRKTLAEDLRRRQPVLEQWQLLSQQSTHEVLASVNAGTVDFAIAPAVTRPSTDIRYEGFAYDGLVVFVSTNLQSQFQGNIYLDQLRRLYTDPNLKTWRDLHPRFPEEPIQRFIPTSNETITLFQQRVLPNSNTIQPFPTTVTEPDNPTADFTVTQRNTFQAISWPQDGSHPFANRTGAIGFDTLAQVLGRCSVFPLAIARKDQPAVAPLRYTNGAAIPPTTNLCDIAGSYGINQTAMRTLNYPLAYSLAVLYLRDNRRLRTMLPVGQTYWQLLTTTEAQCLLQKTGLTPSYAVPSNSHNCHFQPPNPP